MDQHLKRSEMLSRNRKFTKPPQELLEELEEDDIVDRWEADKEEEADYVPVIGILTQPVSDSKKEGGFNYTDYILEVNDNFVKWAGSRTVAIPYDIAEKDLQVLLQ